MKKVISVIIPLVLILSLSITSFTFANSIAYADISRAVKLTKIEISTKNFTLSAGQSKALSLKKIPSNAVFLANKKWGSTNTSVAAVDKNGKVTAKKNGVTLIYFRTWNDNNRYDIIYAVALCHVSKTSPKAAVLKASDIQFTTSKLKIDSSLTLSKIEKLFPDGFLDYDFWWGIISYNFNDVSLYFYAKNEKLSGACVEGWYEMDEMEMKSNGYAITPRGIKIGSSATDVIAKYGYPTWVEEGKDMYGDGTMLGYDYKGDGLVFCIYGTNVTSIGLYSKNNK